MRGLASDLGGIVRAGGVISRFDHGQRAASRGERAGRRWRAGGGGGPSGRAQWAAQGGGQGKWSGAGRAEQAGRAGQNRPRRRARRSGAEQAGRAGQNRPRGRAGRSGAGRRGGRAATRADGWLGQVRAGVKRLRCGAGEGAGKQCGGISVTGGTFRTARRYGYWFVACGRQNLTSGNRAVQGYSLVNWAVTSGWQPLSHGARRAGPHQAVRKFPYKRCKTHITRP